MSLGDWLPPPEAREYQVQGVLRCVAALKEYRAFVLADEMGLGKSVQAIWTAEQLKCERILIVCPAIAKGVWVDQIGRWAKDDKPVRVLSGLQGNSEDLPAGQGWAIVNYDVLPMRRVIRRQRGGGYTQATYPGWEETLSNWRPDLVILDEAHAIKSKEAERTKAVKELRSAAKYSLALTGTTVYTDLLDVWGLFNTLRPSLLKTKFQFAQAYMRPYQRSWSGKRPGIGWVYEGVNEEALPELKAKLAPFMLARRKSDVLRELPPKTRVRIPVEYTGKKSLEGKTLEWLQSLAGKSALTNLLLTLSTCKVPATIEQLSLVSTRRVVVFVHFNAPARKLLLQLGRLDRPAFLISGESTDGRDDTIREWANSDNGVLVVTTLAGGVALNLQAADTVIFNDLEWSPAVIQQAEDRVHRLGQTNPCTIYYMVAKGTVDDHVAEVLLERLEAADKVVGRDGSFIQLTAEETEQEILSRLISTYVEEDMLDED